MVGHQREAGVQHHKLSSRLPEETVRRLEELRRMPDDTP